MPADLSIKMLLENKIKIYINKGVIKQITNLALKSFFDRGVLRLYLYIFKMINKSFSQIWLKLKSLSY